MQLEDGRFLMSAERYDKLLQVRVAHTHRNKSKQACRFECLEGIQINQSLLVWKSNRDQ